MPTINYTPHEKQAEIHDDPSQFRVLACGRKFGKTTAAVMECIKAALSKDSATIWYLAPTYRQAKMIAWRMFIHYLPPEVIRRRNEVELTFQIIRAPNEDRFDSFISLKGTEEEDSLRGVPALNFVVLDECAFMEEHIWPMIIEPALGITQGRALFTGTPAGFNHFHNYFLRGQEGPKGDPDWKSWQFSSWVNPYFPKAQKERIQNFYRKPDGTYDDFYYQEYEANFRRFAGLIYKEFDREVHVVEPFEIPESWPRMPAFDFGYVAPTVCLWAAIKPGTGDIYIYREYYQIRNRISEHVAKIKELIGEERLEAGPADPSRPEIIDEFCNMGIPCFKGDRSIRLGINRVASYLRQKKLFFFKNCEKTIWEIERYEWKKPRGGALGLDLKEEPVDKDNDCMDALRYLLMEHPDLLAIEPSGNLMVSERDRRLGNPITQEMTITEDPIFGDLDV